MQSFIRRIVCAAFALPAAGFVASAGEVDFNRDVRPILANNCYECHGPDEENREGELRLDQFGEHNEHILGTGQPDKSVLVERLLADDEDIVMPPPEARRRPTAEQIETLRRWIEQGAGSQQHWAFVKPVRPELPQVTDNSWPRNSIDRFVLSHLEARKLKPRPDAQPRVLARRLSLALTGLPLLPEQGDRFAEAYRSSPEEAIDNLVDQLLADAAYGEHFAATWLDAARYADTNGYQGDGPRIMWPWRDWLVRNLNANVPYDELTVGMLAGDLLLPQKHSDWETADWISDEPASDLLLATGFLRNHRYDSGSGTIPEESKFENAADRLETVGTIWMGLTLQCARCHTHKFDPIENREYYELLSFFDKVPEVGSALKNASHPYIHTPTEKQRVELTKLQTAAFEAEQQFNATAKHLGDAQAAWEKSLAADSEPPRVVRGLKFHFAQQTIHFNGRKSIKKTNDPVVLCAGNKSWTISFWFRPQSRADGAIFSSVEEPERYRPGIQADWVGGKVRVRHVCRWVNSYIEFESRKKLAVGKWHYVTFGCDGRMQGLAYRATLGGSEAAMACTHPVTNDSAGNSGKAPLVLGGSPLLKGLVGQLRDLRFYDRELIDDEIASLADARTTAAIAAIHPTDRNARDRRTLQLAFLESDALPPRAAELQQTHFETQQQLAQAIRETPTTMVMKDVSLPPTRIRRAGVYDSLGEAVHSGTPAFLPQLSHQPADRHALARWLTHADHPLTSRVAVNRIWQTLWGRGFVDSPENFGTQCAKPEHVELLDWLATEYVRSGWDTKALIKLVVTSRAYRQSSAADEQAWNADPENRNLARGPRYRLPIHVVRDQALCLSGRLDRTIGGPPVVLDEVRGKDGKPQKLPFEIADNRRTLYTFWKRNSPHPVLAVFDAADRNQCDVRVRRTNTPLQALVTLNEPGFAEAAKSLRPAHPRIGRYRCCPAALDVASLHWADRGRRRFCVLAEGTGQLPPGIGWQRRSRVDSSRQCDVEPRCDHDLGMKMNFLGGNESHLSRRTLLQGTGTLLATGALHQLLGGTASAASPIANPAGVKGFPQFPPRAKRVIYLFQAGGPSQLDLFDYKPLLAKWDTKELPKSVMGDAKFTGMVNGQASFPVVAPRWKFQRHGECGAWVSELFPKFAEVVDDVCFLKGMTTTQVDHDAAITYLQTGHQIAGRPSIGAWAAYGLGSECDDLPAFVVLRTEKGGSFLIDRHWGSGFLPSRYQGIRVGGADDEPVQYLNNPQGISPRLRRQTIADIAALNRRHKERVGDPEIDARISQFEMAARMQTSVPELADFSNEPRHILKLYGDDVTQPGSYAYNALMARRLTERGVRFVQLFQGGWDQHSNLPKNIEEYSAYTDRANAALLTDLKQRGLLEDTLVIWGGEFGRTVFCQGKLTQDNFGREHHHLGFTMWLAGAGVRGGTTHGATDEWGFRAVDGRVPVHDFNATVLHLLGIDHHDLTFRFQGRDFRLTDLAGRVVKEI